MRLFVALDITDAVREDIARFVAEIKAFAPNARWMKPESWHVTLAFLGERSEESVALMRNALSQIRCHQIRIALRNYGFFPNPKSARVFWVGIEAAPGLATLASQVSQATNLRMTNAEGYHPHLTLARAAGERVSGSPDKQAADRPNHRFATLQAALAKTAPPDFGSMIATEFYLYRSQLTSHGSNYERLERFQLAPSRVRAERIS